ncbi:tyrosinase family protein [Brevundimonas sp.]|uniref:tyrosinase family protein n=1 Tax=Brevundimonas sp. TaxID=1871086 RepID=UPI003F703EB8
MKIDRRKALAGAAMLGLYPGAAVAQTARRVRRGASSLSATSDDVVAFGEAMALMKRRGDQRSWSRQNTIHARNGQHNNGLFLPWHRLQLAHLERIIAELTGHAAFAMPYWDAQEHQTLPSWVTGTDAPLYERQRARGVDVLDFSAARWARSPHVARLTSDGFETFAGKLPDGAGMVEGYGHNFIHELVGGLMKRLAAAANDPIFWLHHANVDRVWATWHARQAANIYPADWTARRLGGFVGAQGEDTGDWRVGDVLETGSLGYVYDHLYPFPVFSAPDSGPPGATRREPLGGVVYQMRADGEAGRDRMSVTLPAEAVTRMAAADDSLMIAGAGSVAYTATEQLLDRSIEIRMTCGGRGISLGSSPTFLHLTEGEHAGHLGDYSLPFRFGEEVLNLIDDGSRPVTITVEAEDLDPGAGRPPAQGAALDLSLTLTESRWA